MVKHIFLSLAVLFFVTSSAWCGPTMQMENGEWEFTVEAEITGMPMKMPPMTYKQCITKKDPVPQSSQPDQKCVTKDVNYSGNTVTWTTVCKSPGGEMTGKGEATYEKESMQGSMTMDVQGRTMVSKYKGHRIGPCKK